MEVNAGAVSASFDAMSESALKTDSLVFSITRTIDEILQAYRLVYKNYLRAGYIDEHPSEMRYSAHNASPSTVTFCAKLGDAVVTTASVVFDSPLGLPMEAIYHDELEVLRQQGARLCEVTMLADRRRAGMRTIPSILRLFRLIVPYAMRVEKVTDIVITVNPTHAAFYSKYLLFDDLAGWKTYPSVKNAPAVAKRVNLSNVQNKDKRPKLYEFFMGFEPPEEAFAGRKRFTQDELRDLFVVKRPILSGLGELALEWIKSQYGGFDFSAILAPVGK
jgi:hypothetical protein